MAEKRMLKISQLVLDMELYPREKVGWYHVNEMVEALAAKVVLPPIIVDRKTHKVIDGFHRIEAYKRYYDLEDPSIAVTFIDCADEAEMFQRAMELNSTHGQPLSTLDRTQCIKKAEILGMEYKVVAASLNMTIDRIKELRQERFATFGNKPEVLKRTTINLVGQELTEDQANLNKKAGGLPQLFYINQVIGLLESESIDYQNEKVMAALVRLHGLLKGIVLTKVKAGR